MNEKNSILICVSLTAAGLVVEVGFENKSTDPGIHGFFFHQYPVLSFTLAPLGIMN